MFSLNQNLDLAGAWFLIVWREERRVESGINGGRSPPLFPPRRPLDFLHCAFLPYIDFLTTSQRLPQLRAFQFQPLLHHHPPHPQFPLMDIVQVTLIMRELEVFCVDGGKLRDGLCVEMFIIPLQRWEWVLLLRCVLFSPSGNIPFATILQPASPPPPTQTNMPCKRHPSCYIW